MNTTIKDIPTVDLVRELDQRGVLVEVAAAEMFRPELLLEGPDFENAVHRTLGCNIGGYLIESGLSTKHARRVESNHDVAPFNRPMVEIAQRITVLDKRKLL